MRALASGSGGPPAHRERADGPLRPGTVIKGSYRLDALLGEGPSGRVYHAWHIGEHRPLIIKLLHPELAALTAALLRLRCDSQTISRLRHQHLAAAELIFDDHGAPFLVRDLLHGPTLRKRLDDGPLGSVEVARLFVALCGALDTAHRHGVVHGDLKPENLLVLSPRGEVRPVCLDFGMCHLRGGDGGIGAHPLLGESSYLAPEQAVSDGGAPDSRADVFALGAILYECLTGRRAFDVKAPADLVGKTHLERPLPPSRLRPGIPESVDVVVEMACHARADERFASTTALWAALSEALTADPDVEDSLSEMMTGPASAASSTLALLTLRSAPLTMGMQPPDEAEGRPKGPSRPPRQVAALRRLPSGPHAIAVYKELEQSGRAASADSQRARKSAAQEAVRRLFEQKGSSRST